MKAVFLDDGLMRKETLFTPNHAQALSVFDKIDCVFAKDTNLERFPEVARYIHKIESEGPEGWIEPDRDVMEQIRDADVLFVHASGITEEMLSQAARLKAIFLLRSGTEGINIKSATERGIVVCNCPSRLSAQVADMTVALMLAECRGITRGNLRSMNGAWQQEDVFHDCTNAALANLVVGLVGFGGIARAVAKRLSQGFGSRVLAYDPYCSDADIRTGGAEPCGTLEQMLPQLDIVSMHVRLTQETRGMFGAREFSLMKPTALFINTARAGLVDEDALVSALQNGVIRGAGLDVYQQEPLPSDHPFVRMQNVTAMPHRAGVTSDTIWTGLRLLIPEFQRFLKGEPLLFRVN